MRRTATTTELESQPVSSPLGTGSSDAPAAQMSPRRIVGRWSYLLAVPVLLTGLGTALTGCAPMAVVGTAILVNDEFVDNAQTVIVPYEVETVWACTKSTLSHMTSDLLDVDNDLRAVKTFVDGAEVIVQVETYDVGQTRIRVAAKRYLVYSDEVAANVRNRIDRDLR